MVLEFSNVEAETENPSAKAAGVKQVGGWEVTGTGSNAMGSFTMTGYVTLGGDAQLVRTYALVEEELVGGPLRTSHFALHASRFTLYASRFIYATRCSLTLHA